MNRTAIIQAAALGLGLMLSPEMLLMLGNAAGGGGAIFLKSMVLAALLYLALSFIYSQAVTDRGTESSFLKGCFGPAVAVALPLGGRFFLAVSLGTTVVVTAGFVFNETFLYWFPNFAFAAIVLGVGAGLNLIGQRVALWGQVAFAGLAFVGLAVLALIGIFTAGDGEGARSFGPMLPGCNIGMLLPAVLVFAGAEMAGFAPATGPDVRLKGMRTAILLGGAVLLLWALASLFHVPLEKLAGTSTPYTKAARSILGQPGRIIIGIVIISGAAGAVNALMLTMNRMFSTMVEEGIVPRVTGALGGRIPVLVLAAAIGGMMFTGMAGHPEILVFVRAGFVLWLVMYAGTALAGVLSGDDGRISSGVAFAVFLLSIGGLVATDPSRVLLIKTVTIVICIALVLGAVITKLGAPLRR